MDQKPKFDLEERTAVFGENVIAFAKRIPVNPVTSSLINQLVRSATSVGANYCEADTAPTKKDFRYRIGICQKEAKETKHWLRMVAKAEPALADDGRKLWIEARELTLIFSSIIRGK